MQRVDCNEFISYLYGLSKDIMDLANDLSNGKEYSKSTITINEKFLIGFLDGDLELKN